MRRFAPVMSLILLSTLLFYGNARAATIYVVNTTADLDGACEAIAVGDCSLREAITAANASVGTDTIEFDITGTAPFTIQPLTDLPEITDPVVIDGTSQTGYSGTPLIEISGSTFTNYPLSISAGSSIVQGLAITNYDSGIELSGGGDTIAHNYIGVASDGITGSECTFGINITGGGGYTIEDNVIANNAINLVIDNISGETSTITDNLIGLNAAGEASQIEHHGQGLVISNSSDITIGPDNVISGNPYEGLVVIGSESIVIIGNKIGTDISGTTAIPNGTIGWGPGILLGGVTNSRIGGNGSEGNLISGNNTAGILLFQSATPPSPALPGYNIKIQSNTIGSDINGLPLGNSGPGIWVMGHVYDIEIGGSSATANHIAYNSDAGVLLDFNEDGYPEMGQGISITYNSFHDNEGPGIDLDDDVNPIYYGDGVTPNDAGDADEGSNHLQNYPVLIGADVEASGIVIDGTLHSSANTAFTIHFYANSTCDASGYGEGETYLGSVVATTTASGNATFHADLAVSVDEGQYITATATAPDGSTSEFSACKQADDTPTNLIPNGSFEDNDDPTPLAPDGWTPKKLQLTTVDGLDTTTFTDGAQSFRIKGNGTGKKLIQVITTPGAAGNYTLSFDAMGEDVGGSGNFMVKVKVFLPNGDKKNFKIKVTDSGDFDWTTWTKTFNFPAYTKLEVTIQYTRAMGTVWIDDLRLVKN
jgi:CSLREA domain-containing protein